MRVADSAEIFRRGRVFERNDRFVNDVAGGRSDDVTCQQLVRLLVSQDLDETFGIIIRLCPRVGDKGELQAQF